MTRSLPNWTNAPPGGWRFTVKETGKVLGPEPSHGALRGTVISYYKASGYALPGDLDFQIEAQTCERIPEYCGDAPSTLLPPKQGSASSISHTFSAAVTCLKTMYSHLLSGEVKITQEVAESRAAICVACPQNTEVQGCSNCKMGVVNQLIGKIVGAKKTSKDGQLKFCGVCHCGLKAKVWTKHKSIWKNMPESQKKELPAECWLIKESNASD